MAKILIIGGTRYLGLEITKRLASERPEQIFVLNRGKTKVDLPGKVQRIVCDIRNISDVVKTVDQLKPDILIDTILSDSALKQLLPSLGGWLKRYIHTGSIGVYGNADYLPSREEDMPKPSFAGFKQKLAQDEAVLDGSRRHGLPATILRISYIFGRGDVPLELWGGRNPEFFRMLQRGDEILLPGDGSALLHPGHVSDLAKAYLLVLDNAASIGKIYNIGGERSVTLAKYLEMITRAMRVKAKVSWKPAAEAAPVLVSKGLADKEGLLFLMEHMSVDISKAKTELGYRPAVGLEDGMKDNIIWMRERGIIKETGEI